MSEKINCLGKEFASEDERREYFRRELRVKLPELKKIEGFPIGEDEDIIALSDPPYYTACPNPWLNDFIDEWTVKKTQLEESGQRIPEQDHKIEVPYASDVSEGKNNPVFYAHSYHTKVPHPAIMRYILHYTQPGDIVFDGFAGTGMTGVAAQLCGNPDAETKYRIEKEFRDLELSKPIWGKRKAICGDLSPIASLIAYNHNTPFSLEEFKNETEKIINEVEREWGWMYETMDQKDIGIINYTVWSDLISCSNCIKKFLYYDAIINLGNNGIKNEVHCPNCNAVQNKRSLTKSIITTYDKILKKPIEQAETVPVLINYTKKGKRYQKKPEQFDLSIIENIENLEFPFWFPQDELPNGYNTKQPKESHKYTHIHHFYTKRNLIIISAIFNKIQNSNSNAILKKVLNLWFTSSLNRLDKFNRYAPEHKRHVGPLANTLYISPTPTEISPFYFFREKQKAFLKVNTKIEYDNLILIGSATDYSYLKENSIDYIFVDPPFGGNIMYSELNFYYEAWFRVFTKNETEAIVNESQKKGQNEYQELMLQSFKEYYRVLKPGKWITVEFSNTSAAIWNALQHSMTKAGFIISNVSVIDKQRAGLHGIIGPTAVKQDLVISGFKPNQHFDDKIMSSNPEISTWDFVKEFLNRLPVYLQKNQKSLTIIERGPKILYDRLISYFLMHNLAIPIDAREFQKGLKKHFKEEDGMFFTPEQAAEYREKKELAPEFVQLSLLVTTESEGIEWLRQELNTPQKYQDIQPKWMQAITAVRKGDILPELRDLLNDNFIQLPDGKWRAPDLTEASQRDIIRNKSLLKEFGQYITLLNQPKAKKLKEVRVEALRAGFKKCWEEKDFSTIVFVGEKIPQNILLEDEQLLMFYDIAKDRL